MNDETKMILELTEKVAKYELAFVFLKEKMQQTIADERTYVLEVKDCESLLNAIGMNNKEINAIFFDNCRDIAMKVEQ